MIDLEKKYRLLFDCADEKFCDIRPTRRTTDLCTITFLNIMMEKINF